MAYNPVSGAAIQYQDDKGKPASGYYLKFYKANTTTPISMATDATGAATLSKCKLNDAGYPITNPLDNETIFIPYVDQAYRFVIYPTEADADGDVTANAVVNIAKVLPIVTSAQGITSDVEYTGVAGTSVFNVPYTIGFVRVLYNGVMLPAADYTADNGVSVTLASPVLNASDIITFLQVTYTDTEFTGIAGQDTLTISYTPQKIKVLYNGVYLPAADYTATNGSSIVLNDPVDNASDVITVIRLV